MVCEVMGRLVFYDISEHRHMCESTSGGGYAYPSCNGFGTRHKGGHVMVMCAWHVSSCRRLHAHTYRTEQGECRRKGSPHV